MKRRLGNQSGFTVIELMVVVVIIGTLASIAQPNFIRMKMRAEAAAAVAQLETVRAAVLAYNAETGNWPRGRKAGRIPPEIVPHLPKDFSFEHEKHKIDYDYYKNSAYHRFAVGIKTKDKEYGKTVLSMLDKNATKKMGRRYMWFF